MITTVGWSAALLRIMPEAKVMANLVGVDV